MAAKPLAVRVGLVPGLPSTGPVAGDLLPSSEVNSRAPEAPFNAHPGAV